MEKFFQNIKSLFLNILVFLFPLFFLTTTQEYFVTNKLYFLAAGALLLLVVSALEILVTKRLKWETKPLDVPAILFLVSLSLSVIFSSPNKVAALLNPNFGLVIFLILGILYFYFSRDNGTMKQWNNLIIFSSIFLSLITIIFYFQPFNNVSLPAQWQFLKNPLFTPLGGQLDLAVFLGFFLIWGVMSFPRKWESKSKVWIPAFAGMTLVVNLIALSLTVYRLSTSSLIVPPFSNSWYAVLEVMKNAKTAFLGVGPDNFSVVFTRVKDLAYNQSPLWQIGSFNVSRNVPFQILVETGILGFLSFVFLVFTVLKQFNNLTIKPFIWLFAYLIIISLILPPSLPILFLFFIVISVIARSEATKQSDQPKQADLSEFPMLYLGIALVILAATAGAGYFLGRVYAAEYYFKNAINGIAQNNAKQIYDNMRKARIFNRFEERFVLNFAQTNLLIADNLARKEKDKITEADRQMIAQAIQAAIQEAKILIGLNPNKSDYYENLANVYRNIISLAAGADAWTVSSYQRAIILDPVNPSYRLSLGGVYYLLGQYNDAIKLFEQAVSLKPNWANANYNLAWAYFQNKEYDKATNAMQNVVNLTDKKASPKDWEKANSELEDFKNKLAEVQEGATASGELKLPENSKTKLDPKLNLPPEASPEAK